MKHKHKEIKDCEHKGIEYCKKCDVVECKECGKEWKVTTPNITWADGTRIIPPTNNPYYPSPTVFC